MRNIIFALIFLGSTFMVSRFIFEPTYLYYELGWLDIPMHFLGGLEVGYLVISVLRYYRIRPQISHILIGVAVIATTWEIYEFLRETNMYRGWYDYFDTCKDMVLGLSGGYISYKLSK